MEVSQASTNPEPGRVRSPARVTFSGRVVGSIFLFACVSSICTTAGALRACSTAPLVVAVIFIWESYSTHYYPPIVYIAQLLFQYVQAGAVGGFAASIPLGFGAVIYLTIAGLSTGTRVNFKDQYKAYKAKQATSSRLMQLAMEFNTMAITATLVPTGFLFFQLWYGSGMELLAKDNGRVLALAVLADVLASLYMKWRRFARKPAGDAGPSADGGQGPVLEAVVVDMAKE